MNRPIPTYLLAILTALSLALCGCPKGKSAAPTGDYLSSLTATAVWPHSGSGASAVLTPPPTVAVDPARNGRGPAGYAAVKAACDAWNRALGRTALVLLPDGSPTTGASIVVYLSASADEAGVSRAPGDGSGPLTYAYCDVRLTSGASADGQKGGTIGHADIYVYGLDATDVLPGVLAHEFARSLGAVAGSSPNRSDVLYGYGVHPAKPSGRDLETLARIYE